MAVIEQHISKRWAIYNGDCCEILPDVPSDSIGFSIFSPPFVSLYSYSDQTADLSNCDTVEEFFKHFGYVIDELFRVIMPGRLVAVHCMDIPTLKQDGDEIGVWDFPGAIIQEFLRRGFIQHTSRITIWKDPLIAAVRTKAIGLAHKQIIKDSAMSRTGIPDCLLVFRKPGENPRPISHKKALTEYVGSRSIPDRLNKYIDHNDPKTNKRSHWIWQQYASPVWFDIRQTNVLPYRGGKTEEDEKHICPLQLDVIERALALWTSPKDTVLTPFMGIGSEVYVAVKNGRRGVGMELKPSYYRQAVKNLLSIRKKVRTFF